MAEKNIHRIKVFDSKLKALIIFTLTALIMVSCRDDRGLVVEKIKKASKLSTTEFTIDKVVFGVKRKNCFGW